MAEKVRMPKLSASMQEGTIVEWLKNEGDRVTKGEPLYQVETDKAVGEVESPVSGVLISIMKEKGAKVPVNTIIAFIEED
jgi:pyruvate dehydrogenase E2 component (dihydrolipoamide acetyltransferase)